MPRQVVLDNRKCRLLRAMLADERTTLRQAARMAGVTDWTVARWMGQRAFCERLKQIEEYQRMLLRQRAAVGKLCGGSDERDRGDESAGRGRPSPPPKEAPSPARPIRPLTQEEYAAILRKATSGE